MKLGITLGSLLLCTLCFAGYSEWKSKLADLAPGLPRERAEKIISKARGVKSVYDIQAMDTRSTVVYRLDTEFVLVVRYHSGRPRARLAAPGGGETQPVDGSVIEFEVIRAD